MVEEAAHCHGKAESLAALRAGCKTIERGTYLDMQYIRLKGATLIATRTVFEAGLEVRELWSPCSYDKLEAAAATHKAAYKMAVANGVDRALGTDLGLGGTRADPTEKVSIHGNNGKDLVYAVEAEMSPLEAIEAATENAAQSLGPMAPKSGQLKIGWDADLIAVNANPLTDIGVLANAENVMFGAKASCTKLQELGLSEGTEQRK